jgi:hypothetical protein
VDVVLKGRKAEGEMQTSGCESREVGWQKSRECDADEYVREQRGVLSPFLFSMRTPGVPDASERDPLAPRALRDNLTVALLPEKDMGANEICKGERERDYSKERYTKKEETNTVR